MKARDIKVGRTYQNRGAGKTHRTVIAIGDEHRPEDWYGDPDKGPPNEPGVLFTQDGGSVHRTLYLSMFAQWAGNEYKL